MGNDLECIFNINTARLTRARTVNWCYRNHAVCLTATFGYKVQMHIIGLSVGKINISRYAIDTVDGEE